MSTTEAPEHPAVATTPETPAPAAAPARPFSDAEWAALKRQDVRAGASVVCIMATIFTVGLLLYTAIFLIAVF